MPEKKDSRNPISLPEVDKLFTDILSTLSHLYDERKKLSLIADFLEDVRDFQEDITYSYFLQLSATFYFLTANISLDSLMPEEITRLIEEAKFLKSRLKDKVKEPEICSSLSNLHLYLAANYFYLGEIEKGYGALLKKENIDKEDWQEKEGDGRTLEADEEIKSLIESLSKNEGSNFKVFAEFRTRFKASPPIAESLEFIFQNWKSVEEVACENEINCLLVECDFPGEGECRGRNIAVSVYSRHSPGADGHDIIHFLNMSPSVRSELLNVAMDAATASDSFYRQLHKRSSRESSFVFTFPEKGFIYSGGSIGLPLSLLTYNQKLLVNMNSVFYKFKKSASFTGNIGLKGEVQKIDPGGLKTKIESAFFSPLRFLVLPKQNLKEALPFLYALKSQWPSRKFKLIGVDNLEEVIRDGRLLRLQTIPFLKYAFQKTSVLARFLLGIFIFIAFLFAAILISRNPSYHFWKNRDPAQLKIVQNTIIALNKEGQELWNHDFELQVYPFHLNRWLFADINRDKKKELLFPYCPYEQEIFTSQVICFSHRGKRLWHYVPGKKVATRKEEFTNKYMAIPRGVFCLNDRNKENFIVIGASHSPWCPYQVSILDTKGKLVGEYWNSGHLSSDIFITEDLDQDGIKEMIFGGQNNGYNRACLVVLDPRKTGGASPQDETPDYKFLGMEKGTEKYYLLFPRSILNKLYHIRNYVHKINLYREDKKIEVIIYEHNDALTENRVYLIRYILDYNMNVLEVQPEDYFTAKLIELKTMKVIPEIPKEEIYKLKDLVEYWDGDKWTKTPSMNKYYLK